MQNVTFTVIGTIKPKHDKIIYYKEYEILSNALKHINDLEKKNTDKNILYRVRLDIKNNIQLDIFN